jgi:hypothetical protein
MQEILNAQKVLVCEDQADVFKRIAHALDRRGAIAVRLPGLPALMHDDLDRRCLVVVSAAAVHPDDAALVLQRTHGRPVVWIAQAPGPPAWITPQQPAHLLPFNFSGNQLCCLLTRLAHKLDAQAAPPVRRVHAEGQAGVNLLACTGRPSRINLSRSGENAARL